MRRTLLAVASVTALIAMANAASASAAALYVDDSGADTGDCTVSANPCQTITYALNLAGTDVIHIGGGSYTEDVEIGGSETLMEDSAFSGAAAGQAVLTSPPGDTAIEYFTAGTVQGLTIRSDTTAVRFAAGGDLTGNTFDTSALPSGLYGADVVIDGLPGISPSITGNTFVDTVPDNQLGLVANSNGSPTISGNTFSGFYQAIEALSGSVATPTISGNVITGAHEGSGVGIGTGGAISPTITGNFVHSPGTGNPSAITVTSTGVATLNRNRTIGHAIGVKLSSQTSATMQSDLVVKATTRGIDISGMGTIVTADNVTVIDSAPSLGDIKVGSGTALIMDSSIVGGGGGANGALGIEAEGDGTCGISDSRGNGDSGLFNNCDDGFISTADPMFVNRAANDYHLLAGSPMIDLGNIASPPPGTLDVDGDDRALGVAAKCTTPPAGRRDIGADEFITPCPPPVVPPTTTPPATKKCKKGQKVRKGKCVKKKRKKRKKKK